MPILIDSHVHIYPEFSLARFFDAVCENFARAAVKKRASGDLNYVLALTEGGDNNVFAQLKSQAQGVAGSLDEQNSSEELTFYETAEEESLIVRKGKQTFVLVAGRQLISKENIELLSLLSSRKVEDRVFPLRELVGKVVSNGALPVVPWGVGKWLGARGQVVADLLKSKGDAPLLFGDNGNRPPFWPEPLLLRHAREHQIPILSGSDPLPIASHETRAASYGSFLPDAELSMECPAASLHTILVNNRAEEFGQRIQTFAFVADQLRLNLQKRFS